MKRSFLILTVLVFAFVLFPTPKSSAIVGPGFFVRYLDPQVTCTATDGTVHILLDRYFPAGYIWREHFVRVSDVMGDMDVVNEHIFLTDRYEENEVDSFYTIPPDGSVTDTVEIYTPAGLLVSSATVYASCPDGTVIITGSNIYGIQPPAANARVMGHVQYDTPLYAEPNPDTEITGTLRAGQTWFVVDDATGTDGELWYEVFVGGWHNAFVPAETLMLNGPIPN